MSTRPMARLERFIGTWNTTGDVLETEAGPATVLAATDLYRWLPGRHFIVHEVDARFGDSPARSMEVIGFDAASRKYLARSFDDQGATERFEVALKGRKWTIVGESVRFNGMFNADDSQLTGWWELKGKERGWQPWIRLKLARAA